MSDFVKDFVKSHWAFQIANRILQQKKHKKEIVLASGITPSGQVHVGNFREVVTVFFVQKAIEYLEPNRKVKFIFSWDNYDVFRKVPSDIPNREQFKRYLGESISEIPTPYQEISLSKDDEEWQSYAEYNQKKFEFQIQKVGIDVHFLYQSQKYCNFEYVELIKTALQKRDKIREILNQYRNDKLGEDWYPITIFCNDSKKNDVSITNYDGEYKIDYQCSITNKKKTIDFSREKGLKLLWRIDWPMRWQFQQVDFEPGGKDHSSDGGSFTTAQEISEQIYDYPAPIYLSYNFVGIKGIGGKISSSKGNVITLEDVLKVYQPEIVRYLFASYRANVEFSISFDLDVIRIYEDFDKLERKFYRLEECSAKKIKQVEAIYLLSSCEKFSFEGDTSEIVLPQKKTIRASFRHLTNILQIYDFDKKKVIDYYCREDSQFKEEKNLISLQNRIDRAEYWIKNYAPEDFRFSLMEKNNVNYSIFSDEMKLIFKKMKDFLSKQENLILLKDSKKITDYLYDIIKSSRLEESYFFRNFYLLLINKEKGPKLGNFLTIIEKERLLSLLSI